jgi:bifunctional non-homologous end joining protein LigD
MKKKLEDVGLVPFIMTTGSRAYHIVVPLQPTRTFEQVHEFTKNLANEIADEYPELLTTNPLKAQRKGRILVDYMRNSFGATSVAPYAVRALEGAPVATPISWDELSTTDPQKYSIKNIFRRLARKKDPWKDFKKSAKTLKM